MDYKTSKISVISEIKKKKELEGISDSIVETALLDHLRKHKINLENLSKKEIKIIIKEIRASLRNLVGRFQRKVGKRKSLTGSENIQELLTTHASTSERMDFYDSLKNKIKELKIISILDLGCGLNPLALASPEIIYYACDINEHELKIISDFFKQNNIRGSVFLCDLKKIQEDLPKADLCLLLKVIDVIDPAGKKRGIVTENILKNIQCKFFLISFSTKKLSGRRMNFPRRKWFERILKKSNLKFSTFKSSNEFFYLIENNKFTL